MLLCHYCSMMSSLVAKNSIVLCCSQCSSVEAVVHTAKRKQLKTVDQKENEKILTSDLFRSWTDLQPCGCKTEHRPTVLRLWAPH